MNTLTKSQEVAADVAALLRARNPLIWIVSREEGRVERYMIEACANANYVPRTWDVGQGLANMNGEPLPENRNSPTNDPGAALNFIGERAKRTGDNAERGVWIMRDLPVWLAGPPGAVPLRQLRNLARTLPGIPKASNQAIVVVSPSSDVPPELAGHVTVINWPLPDREEIGDLVDAAVNSMPPELQDKVAPNGTRDAAIDAAVGLSGDEAQACFAKSLVKLKRIDPPTIAKEKKRVIEREKVLEYFEPLPGGLDAVGGLDNLKAWLVQRRSAYSAAARAYGLPSPKGCVLVGVPGCGKSLTAKAIATAWGIPLVKLDLGALKSKFVGDSEQNIRKAFATIEAIGRCVVWLDEIEKSLQGATTDSSDGGVSADALGAILNWMNERKGEAFIIATANDVSKLPPEVLRKGRFDEVWFVDTPTQIEREQVLSASLRAFNRDGAGVDLVNVAKACDGFTGAEIAALVPDALFAAFNDNAREVSTSDLLSAAKTVVPLTKTAAEKIGKLREWATGRARLATSAEAVAPVKSTRELDID